MGGVLSDILANHWGKIVLCILLISGATIGQYFFLYTATYAINTLHYSQSWAMTANFATFVSGTIFALLGGALADRYSLKTIAVVPRIIVTLLFYPALLLVVSSGSPAVYVVTVAVLMAFHAMSGGAGIILIPLIFPAIVRTSGLSIAYALGVTIFGGTAQLVFTGIIGATGDKLSWVWYVVAMGAVSILATMVMRMPEGVEQRRSATTDAAVAGSSR
ncbi:hypothetical protein [Bradyrhizobium sp. CCGUVB14]|nr:hypothetical protein [Bradyrhizobium sp. CCGUVB14]MCP3440088.1 hypothetical protein [Bradyrhizobium sp. CCGUVB14]